LLMPKHGHSFDSFIAYFTCSCRNMDTVLIHVLFYFLFQIISFLKSHAHPKMVKQVSLIRRYLVRNIIQVNHQNVNGRKSLTLQHK